MKKRIKKLTLNAQTVRILAATDLELAVGGTLVPQTEQSTA